MVAESKRELAYVTCIPMKRHTSEIILIILDWQLRFPYKMAIAKIIMMGINSNIHSSEINTAKAFIVSKLLIILSYRQYIYTNVYEKYGNTDFLDSLIYRWRY